MKKILAAALTLVTLLSIVGCGKKYKAVKSTKEEARTVVTFTVDGEKYEVKYELYRALFLNYKSTVDGGDDSVWSGEDADRYIKEIDELILSRAAEIYAAIALAEELGINPYSSEIEKKIYSHIEMSVDGNGVDVVGFDGDYNAYLASLKEMNLNYSVQVLLLRYSIVMEAINEYYIGYEDEALGHIDGDYEFTKEDVKSFYNSNGSVRLLHAFVGKNKLPDAKERAEKLRADIASAESAEDVALLIINRTTGLMSDNFSGKEVTGIVIGKNNISDTVYASYADTAFALKAGEVSEVIEIGGTEPGYYVIYVLEKTNEHFESCYETVKLAYLDDVIGTRLKEKADLAVWGAKYSEKYADIEHKNISME